LTPAPTPMLSRASITNYFPTIWPRSRWYCRGISTSN